MEEWLKLTLMLSAFGFLKDMQPSDAYFYDFLIGEWRDITPDQVNREVFPVGTYAYLAQLIIVFLIADFLRYKPLLILIGFCGIAISSLLLWTSSLFALQIMQVIYGTFVAAEIAYYPYIFAKVDRIHYPKVSSYARSAMLAGSFIGNSIGQILVAYKWMDYRQLNYLTLGSHITATIWSFLLPSVKPSLYFHQHNDSVAIDDSQVSTGNNFKSSTQAAFTLIKSHFIQAYSNPEVLQWSIWYALGLCGNLLVLEYRQVLWDKIDNTQEVVWNGAVEGVVKLACAIAAFLTGHLYNKTFIQRRGLTLLAVFSIAQSGLILLSCLTDSRWISYFAYLLFNIVFAFLITITTVEIAKHLIDESFGLVFGINTFFASLLTAIMTIVFISESGFHLSLINQYITFAIYFFMLGSAYLIFVVLKLIRT